MRLSSFLPAPLLFFLSLGAAAQSALNPDFNYGSVIESFRKHDPTMVHFSLLYRGQASEELDVILVRGGRTGWPQPLGTVRTFAAGDLVGLFLVSRSNPSLAYELVVEAYCARCAEELIVDHASNGSIVMHGVGDYGMSTPRRKYVYDARSKRLLYRTDLGGGLPYLTLENEQPVFWGQVWPGRDRREPAGTVAFTPEASAFRQVRSDYPVPGFPRDRSLLSLVPNGSCALMERTENFTERFVRCESSQGAEVFRTPRATPSRFEAERSKAFTYGGGLEPENFNETIGPYQLEGNLLWFGLTFYDGEGSRGIGGFGKFDLSTNRFDLIYPPEFTDWSVAAMLVESEAIWFSLSRRPEGAGYSGGLVRWERATGRLQHWPETPLITGIARAEQRLYMATDEGVAAFEDGELTRFLLDVNEQSQYRLVKRELR